MADFLHSSFMSHGVTSLRSALMKAACFCVFIVSTVGKTVLCPSW